MRSLSILLVPVLLASTAATQRQEGASFPLSMDFGPCLTTTLKSRGPSGTTLKGLVVRLGDSDSLVFDTELLRLSSAWTDGWLYLRGTPFDGSHGPVPAPRGRALFEVGPGPGWAYRGKLDDPRSIPHGPLPRAWGRFQGHWLTADGVVIGYSVDDMQVRERFVTEFFEGDPVLVREMNLGPSAHEQVMVLADAPEKLEMSAIARQGGAAMMIWKPDTDGPVWTALSTAAWDRLGMGAPSDADYLDASSGTAATARFVPGCAKAHHAPQLGEGEEYTDATTGLPRIMDGQAARNDDDPDRSHWFDKAKGDQDGRIHVDLQKKVDVSRINTFTWHKSDRAEQNYELFASDEDTPPSLDAKDPAKAGWRKVAHVRTGHLSRGDKHGASVTDVGSARHLLFVVRSNRAFFSEIDVFADSFVAPVDRQPQRNQQFMAMVNGGDDKVKLAIESDRVVMRVAPHDEPLNFKLAMSSGPEGVSEAVMRVAQLTQPAVDLSELQPDPNKLWGAPEVTKGRLGDDEDVYAVDTITVPFKNQHGSRMRICAFDFFEDGRAAISTWNGDVWIVGGIDADLDEVTWSRFATGLFDPLGLKIIDDTVYVHGRDGITRLFDVDGNGEADFYECFNNDVQITESFHEFAFDLQLDKEGNFYISKGAPVRPGGRGFDKIVPHHGTIMRISKDGQRLDVLATGLRAPNGIGVSPTGILTSGDNEGTWMPRCRLNWITEPGYYAGVRDTAHRPDVPETPNLPLCWMPMEVDNSSGGQVWVPDDRWGPLAGRCLHLSYGTCGIYLVLPEEVDGQIQGGVVRFPVSLTSSAMRGRFDPRDGQLYVSGFQGWQTTAAREGGFHRIRYTGKPLTFPVNMQTCEGGVYLTFDTKLDEELATDPTSYGIEIWNYVYSQNYGSPEVSLEFPDRKVEQGKRNRDVLAVRSAKLSADGKTVFLDVPGIRPVMQMRISYNLDAADGALLKGDVYNTIHALASDPGMPQ